MASVIGPVQRRVVVLGLLVLGCGAPSLSEPRAPRTAEPPRVDAKPPAVAAQSAASHPDVSAPSIEIVPGASVHTLPVHEREKPLRCGSDEPIEEGFHFELSEPSRVRLTLESVGVQWARLEVVPESPRGERRCSTDWISGERGPRLEWTANLEPGRHRVFVTLGRSPRWHDTARHSEIKVTLERAAPARTLYDRPLTESDIRRERGEPSGDSFEADARVRLSCTEPGAPTELFELTVYERSALTIWVPPEIDPGHNVFAVLRLTDQGHEELACGPELHAVLPKGSYVLVAAGASRDRMGEFFIPVALHSLEAEERSARAATRLPLDTAVHGSTRGRTDVFDYCDVRRVGHAAPDRVYRVRVPRAGSLSIRVQPKGDYDGWVAIRDANLAPLDPERSDCETFPGGPLVVPVTPGEYLVIVDGIGLSEEEGRGSFAGDFTIRATLE